MQDFFIEPDTGGTVYAFNDEVDLGKTLFGAFDIFVLEAFQIELFKIFGNLCTGRLQGGVTEFVIKGIEPFTLKQMVYTLASFTTEIQFPVIFLLFDHDRFIEFEIAMGTCDFCQKPSFLD